MAKLLFRELADSAQLLRFVVVEINCRFDSSVYFYYRSSCYFNESVSFCT